MEAYASTGCSAALLLKRGEKAGLHVIIKAVARTSVISSACHYPNLHELHLLSPDTA
jgi:hypothetical protein